MSFNRKMFGARLKEARLERGLTQTHVADLTGMRQSRISEYETGRYLMSLDVLTDYIERCDLNPGTVFPQWYVRAKQINRATSRQPASIQA